MRFDSQVSSHFGGHLNVWQCKSCCSHYCPVAVFWFIVCTIECLLRIRARPGRHIEVSLGHRSHKIHGEFDNQGKWVSVFNYFCFITLQVAVQSNNQWRGWLYRCRMRWTPDEVYLLNLCDVEQVLLTLGTLEINLRVASRWLLICSLTFSSDRALISPSRRIRKVGGARYCGDEHYILFPYLSCQELSRNNIYSAVMAPHSTVFVTHFGGHLNVWQCKSCCSHCCPVAVFWFIAWSIECLARIRARPGRHNESVTRA